MRPNRLGFIFLAFYLVFLGGSAYYTLFFPIRVFHHMLVTILLIVWLFTRFRRKQGLPDTPLNRPILGIVIVWLISAALSLDPRMAFENLWFPFTHLLFFFALVDLLQRGRQRLVFETQFLLAALVVFVSGLELASWYFGLGITPGTSGGWADVIGPGVWLPLTTPRLALAMNISTLLAGYVAPLITLTIGWALTARRRDYRIVLWLLAGLLGIVLVLTFSRGGILSVITALGALGVMRLSQNPRVTQRFPARRLIGVALVAGGVMLIVFVLFTLSQSRRSGDEGRLDMWNSAVEITRDNPLFGVGPGLYGRAFRIYRDPVLARDKLASAHNAYLNTAAETGLAGIAVSFWIGIVFVRTVWQTWQAAPSQPRKLRVETAFAGLLGIGVHSMVDVFTTTPIVLVILLLAAYSITGQRSRLDIPPPTRKGQRWSAATALAVVVAYGLWFIQLDRAQSFYQRSLQGTETALDDARTATTIDPGLRLYPLQIAHLVGQHIVNIPENDLTPAIEAYHLALELEPTWDTGWINLAALHFRQGNVDQALASLQTGWRINPMNTASLHWARLAEQANAGAEADILAAYASGIALDLDNPDLPLSEFWTQTELRRQTVGNYTAVLPLDWQYRIFAAHDPARASTLVPADPQSAAEWWATGEYALTTQNDREKAIASFTKAIEFVPTTGDYYVARARAEWPTNPQAAERDLKIAQLLGTQFEYPNAVRAQMASTPEDQRDFEIRALPIRSVGQEFAAVLYGRASQFDVFPEMRNPGPGRAALQPWYNLAQHYIAAGRTENAVKVYRAILEYVPFDNEAREQLATLQSAED
jgi:tetratricopeptide (TPR) repeat protein